MKAIQLPGAPDVSSAGALSPTERWPVVCVPLVARTATELLAEAQAVGAGADVVEWRIDFFADLAQAHAVAELAPRIKQAARGLPLLLTRRSVREGGAPHAADDTQVLAAYAAACASGAVAIADWEMSSPADQLAQVRQLTQAAGVQLLLSFHDFQATPSLAALHEHFDRAHALGADIAKVAVMPRTLDDVLTLLGATLQASRRLPLPLVGLAMGPLGAITRVAGWQFGSAMTFAQGVAASAPGQLPLADLRAVLAVLQRADAGAAAAAV